MLLNDISRVPTTTLKKINQHLESNYGFRITEDAKDQDLVSIMETIQDEISDLKMQGNDAKASPEISKRLLVLEGIKTLREFAIIQLQSPDLESVISKMTGAIVDNFRIGGTSQADFDEAVRDAMKVYRSSKYRFPDDYIEQRVREGAQSTITSPGSTNLISAPMMEDIDEDDQEAPVDSTASNLDEDDTSVTETTKNVSKGNAMREHQNLVRNLRRLLETEVSQAEVMMAAKKFAEELQEMVEKIGRLQNEDLPPVTDQMRETYGNDSSSAFQTQIYGALQGVMDSLYTAKNQVDDAVSNMAQTGQVSAAVDMDKDMGQDVADMGGDEGGGEELDLDNIGDEGSGDEGDMGGEDEFGGAEGEEPLGRAMKESALQRKIMEMQKLVAKARKLKEAKEAHADLDEDEEVAYRGQK